MTGSKSHKMPGNMACNILGAINQDLTTLQVEFIVNVGWMLPHVRYFTWGRIYIYTSLESSRENGRERDFGFHFPRD